MTRVTPRLLLAVGALLLAAWLVVPLASSPRPQSPAQTAGAVALPTPAAPELDEINREVDRLRERLVEPSRDTAPARDPFQFAEPPIVPSVGRAPAADELVREPERPIITWPSLVAILSSGSEASPTRQAVFEDASELMQFRSAGEAMGDIIVTAIAADTVTLTHTPSGESTQVALR